MQKVETLLDPTCLPFIVYCLLFTMITGIQHLARHFVRSVQSETGIELDYNHVAIKWLDGYIENIRTHYTAETVPAGLVQSVGAFVGECIIATYGGHWGHDRESDEWGVAVPVNGGDVWLYPFNKVYKHFAAGHEHSIGLFFEAIKNLTDPTRDWHIST